MRGETLFAKRQLYSALLKKGMENLSDNEIEIMSLLGKDKEIQEFLNKQVENERKDNKEE